MHPWKDNYNNLLHYTPVQLSNNIAKFGIYIARLYIQSCMSGDIAILLVHREYNNIIRSSAYAPFATTQRIEQKSISER